jgi:hypothetical protein
MKILLRLSVIVFFQLSACSGFGILGFTPLPTLFGRLITTGVVKTEDIVQQQTKPEERDFGDYPDNPKIVPILIESKFPGLKLSPAFMSLLNPPSERKSPKRKKVLTFLLRIKRRLSPGFAYTMPWKGTGVLFPQWCKDLYGEVPVRPVDFSAKDKIAGIAQRGPFSVYFHYDPTRDQYVLDLSKLEAAEPRKPFVRAGGIARVVKEGKTFRTAEVSFDGQISRPGDQSWDMFQKRFLVGLNTYATALDHLIHMHILGGGTLSLCTFLTLPPQHPLRILLQPVSHGMLCEQIGGRMTPLDFQLKKLTLCSLPCEQFVVETNLINNKNINGLILTERDNVPSYSGYNLETVNRLLRQTMLDFDIRFLDPVQRFQKYGQSRDISAFPTAESAIKIYRILEKYVDAWVKTHVKTVDERTRDWVRELNNRTPNGILPLVGIESLDRLTLSHVSHIATTLMFAASVWHHLVADLTTNYFMQFDVMPPAMDRDGYPTFGVMIEKRNSILIAAILRFKLFTEIDYFDDPSMANFWNQLQNDLKEYAAELDKKPAEIRSYCIDPRLVPSSIHA